MCAGRIFPGGMSDAAGRNFTVDHIVRNFDIDGTFVAQASLNAADNFGRGALLIEEDGARDRDFIVDAALRVESFDLVMQKRIFLAVFSAGRATDDDDGRFFGVGAGNGIEDIQSAHAISDADQTDAVDAGISVSREAGAGLVGHGDAPDPGLFQPGKCRQREVARNTETMTNASAIQIFEEKFA